MFSRQNAGLTLRTETHSYSWRHKDFLAVEDSAGYKGGWRCRSRSYKAPRTDMQGGQS